MPIATMSVRADPKRSLMTLSCTVLFLTWICHIGRSQTEDIPIAVCEDPIINSSAPMSNGDTFNCTFQEIVTRLFNSCNGSVTLEADPVAFIHSQSSVITRVNSSDSNETLSYNLCIFPPKFLHTELIGCTHNGTEVAIDVDWKRAGVTIVSVFIYDEGKSFMGCARTNITIAENSGLELNVSLLNDPLTPSITPFPPSNVDPSVPHDIDVLRSIYDGSGDRKYYLVGNITFFCETNHSEGDMYFKYSFGDRNREPYTNADNITHIYKSAGNYNYTVDAVAINRKGSWAFHAAHNGHINVLEPVSGIKMKVNDDNKFEVNMEYKVNISAFGSRPIIACWYVTTPESIVYHPVDPDPTEEPTVTPSPRYTCRQINESQTSLMEPMTFYEVGQYVFVAVFYNNASKANDTIPFGVVQSPSKAVVASTSTLIAILAILIAVVSLLMIIMGLYIPYRKYKTKFTETANFKFVDLSESTQWDRAKVKVREFADKLNRNRKSSKVGLVNEQSESTRLMHFPYVSVS